MFVYIRLFLLLFFQFRSFFVAFIGLAAAVLVMVTEPFPLNVVMALIILMLFTLPFGLASWYTQRKALSLLEFIDRVKHNDAFCEAVEMFGERNFAFLLILLCRLRQSGPFEDDAIAELEMYEWDVDPFTDEEFNDIVNELYRSSTHEVADRYARLRKEFLEILESGFQMHAIVPSARFRRSVTHNLPDFSRLQFEELNHDPR